MVTIMSAYRAYGNLRHSSSDQCGTMRTQLALVHPNRNGTREGTQRCARGYRRHIAGETYKYTTYIYIISKDKIGKRGVIMSVHCVAHRRGRGYD